MGDDDRKFLPCGLRSLPKEEWAGMRQPSRPGKTALRAIPVIFPVSAAVFYHINSGGPERETNGSSVPLRLSGRGLKCHITGGGTEPSMPLPLRERGLLLIPKVQPGRRQSFRSGLLTGRPPSGPPFFSLFCVAGTGVHTGPGELPGGERGQIARTLVPVKEPGFHKSSPAYGERL